MVDRPGTSTTTEISTWPTGAGRNHQGRDEPEDRRLQPDLHIRGRGH